MWRDGALAKMDGPIKEFEAAWRQGAAMQLIPTSPGLNADAVRRLSAHLMLLEPVQDSLGDQFRARLVGAHHRPLDACCRAGRVIGATAPHAARAALAAKTGQPAYASAEDAASGSLAVFPFSSNGKTVDRLIAVTARG